MANRSSSDTVPRLIPGPHRPAPCRSGSGGCVRAPHSLFVRRIAQGGAQLVAVQPPGFQRGNPRAKVTKRPTSPRRSPHATDTARDRARSPPSRRPVERRAELDRRALAGPGYHRDLLLGSGPARDPAPLGVNRQTRANLETARHYPVPKPLPRGFDRAPLARRELCPWWVLVSSQCSRIAACGWAPKGGPVHGR